MHPINRGLQFFPAFIIILAGICGYCLLVSPSALKLSLLAFILYGLPLASFRCLNAIAPIREGACYLDSAAYNPWFAANRIQDLYNTFPIIESVLMLFPGLFSFWLRLWGSSIGAHVFWTSRLWITDRGLLQVGDHAVFGYGVICLSHVIKPHRGRIVLYVKTIRIGRHAFIGVGSRLGPGTVIESHASLPVLTDLYVNRKVSSRTENPSLHAPV